MFYAQSTSTVISGRVEIDVLCKNLFFFLKSYDANKYRRMAG